MFERVMLQAQADELEKIAGLPKRLRGIPVPESLLGDAADIRRYRKLRGTVGGGTRSGGPANQMMRHATGRKAGRLLAEAKNTPTSFLENVGRLFGRKSKKERLQSKAESLINEWKGDRS